jgi:hypothetical protein
MLTAFALGFRLWSLQPAAPGLSAGELHGSARPLAAAASGHVFVPYPNAPDPRLLAPSARPTGASAPNPHPAPGAIAADRPSAVAADTSVPDRRPTHTAAIAAGPIAADTSDLMGLVTARLAERSTPVSAAQLADTSLEPTAAPPPSAASAPPALQTPPTSSDIAQAQLGSTRPIAVQPSALPALQTPPTSSDAAQTRAQLAALQTAPTSGEVPQTQAVRAQLPLPPKSSDARREWSAHAGMRPTAADDPSHSASAHQPVSDRADSPSAAPADPQHQREQVAWAEAELNRLLTVNQAAQAGPIGSAAAMHAAAPSGSAATQRTTAPQPMAAGRVMVDGLVVRGALAPTTVKRALERLEPDLTQCYQKQPARDRILSGPVHVDVLVDETGRVRNPSVQSSGPSGLNECVSQISRKLVSGVPTGTANISWTLNWLL